MHRTTGRNGGLLAALAALGVLGCDSPMSPIEAASAPGPSLAVAAFVITGMRGTGGMGDGSPTFYGTERQWFNLDVGVSGGLPYGTLDYIDSAFVKSDGNYPHFVAGPAWPGTAITSFAQTSTTCAEFEGVGRLLNTDELLAFAVETCDNAQPGVGFDTFGITVPQRLITNGNVYRAGPLPLVYGELTASGTVTPTLGLP